jgi:hypothetical protein
MPPPKWLATFHHREFEVVLAQDGGRVRAVARDSKRQQAEEVSGDTAEDVTAEIKTRLNAKSQTFVGIDSAINLFLTTFPGGFNSDFYKYYERDYKDEAIECMKTSLSRENLESLILSRGYGEVSHLATRALNNLADRFEHVALDDALKSESVAAQFANELHELLYGDFEHALERMAVLLRPHNAAKWPILTFWPFFRFPARHMFLKPTIVRTCAERMGYELHYEPLPNRETYRSLLGFTEFLRDGIATLAPKDNIDLQTFMYVVGKEGYVRHAVSDRERWAAGGSARRGAPLPSERAHLPR